MTARIEAAAFTFAEHLSSPKASARYMEHLASLELIRARAWNGPWAKLPQKILDYPSMLSAEERRMLRWLASRYYTGAGSVCDLGSFLGGSTISLADGLRAAGHGAATVHSYDYYEISDELWTKYMSGSALPRPDGKDAFPAVKALLSEYANCIQFNKGDILNGTAPDGDIEICFVDISKTFAINDHIVAEFFTKLIPGRSIVIQQDYFHPTPPWDVVTMELLSDYFDIISFADINSAVFLNTRKVDAAAVERAHSKNFTKKLFTDNIRAAGRRWPFAAQKAHLYRSLLVTEAAEGLPDKAWHYNRFAKDTNNIKLSAEAVYAAFGALA